MDSMDSQDDPRIMLPALACLGALIYGAAACYHAAQALGWRIW